MLQIDGTGWVRDPLDRQPLMASGQIFRMASYHANHPKRPLARRDNPNNLTDKEEPMTPNDYATDLERVNEEVVTFVRSCSDDQWRTNVPGENWPVGVVIHHVAAGHQLVSNWIESARDGRDIAITGEEIDSANARHADEQMGVTASETVELLGSNGATLAALIRSLNEDEMERKVHFAPAGGALFSTEQLCGAASGHVKSHLAHAKEALGREHS